MTIEITTDFIKLGQALKKISKISTGGQAKDFIETHEIKINNKEPEGRGSKLRDGDVLWVDDQIYSISKK